MLKRLVNECLITLRIEATGPILIKAGAQTLAGPDMAFVRVWRHGNQEVYLPGSSLKGVVRSHAERNQIVFAKYLAGLQISRE